VDFQQSLKARREKSSFGSKEGLMPTDASGSKSKEHGFKICRGTVRQQTGSEARLGGGDLSLLRRIRFVNSAIIIDELQV
jgi:hypothetical protein